MVTEISIQTVLMLSEISTRIALNAIRDFIPCGT